MPFCLTISRHHDILNVDTLKGKLHLTHLALDKMADILADDYFRCFFLNEKGRIPIRILLKYVPRSSIDNKPALVQAMTWRWTGEKSLPETMLIQFTYAYTRH